MVDIRRVIFTRARITKLLADLKNGRSMPSWAVNAKQSKGVLYIDDREVVPREDQQGFGVSGRKLPLLPEF